VWVVELTARLCTDDGNRKFLADVRLKVLHRKVKDQAEEESGK
jgi:hypothetical protein